DVAPEYPTVRGPHHQLYQHRLRTSRENVQHRPETRPVDLDLAIRARLRLSGPDRADLRLGEDAARHHGMIDRRRTAAEHRVGEGLALTDRGRCQLHPRRDVTDRVDRG